MISSGKRSLALQAIVYFTAFFFAIPLSALDPKVFVIEDAQGNHQIVDKVEEVQMPDGSRKVLVWSSLAKLPQQYAFPREKFDDAFRVLCTSDPQGTNEWMLHRSWNSGFGVVNQKTLGDAPARATIFLRLSPGGSIESVRLRMKFDAFAPVYLKFGRLSVSRAYDYKDIPLDGATPALKRKSADAMEGYAAVGLKVNFSLQDRILPLEQTEDGRYRVAGTDAVFATIPPGSLRYLDENEANAVRAEYAKFSNDPAVAPLLQNVVQELVAFQEPPEPRKAVAPPTFSQRCSRFFRALCGVSR